MITSLDIAFLSFSFLAPGFIIKSTLGFLFPQRSEVSKETPIELLTLSMINYGVWSWLIYLLLYFDPLPGYGWLPILGWTWVLLLGPIGLALIWAIFRQKEVISKLLQKIGLRAVHVIPTAWDFKFRKLADSEGAWVVATLKNDVTLAGYLGHQSFASNERGERDLYIEDIYTIDDNGKWEQAPGNDGVLIKASEIAYIEFRK